MDPKFLKWMAEAMEYAAGNMKLMEKSSGWPQDARAAWLKMWPSLPGFPAPPMAPEGMERLYREWLALFGAVPLKDYEELKARVEELEAQRERAGKAMDLLAQGMADLKDVPEAMKPWMEFMDKAAKAQMEWFAGLGKPREAGSSQGKGPDKEVKQKNK
jgi:hypothetical protein